MLRLVLRRASVQRLLLSAVVVLIAVAATLMGICSLLLGVTGSKAFDEQVRRLEAQQVDVTAYAVDVKGQDLGTTRRTARGVVQQVLAPMRPSLVSTATSRMRRLGDAGLGYLATSDARTGQGVLTSGRWPARSAGSRVEAVAPAAAVRNLHLRLGDSMTLGSETGLGGNARPVKMVLVGTFRASSQAAWASDPLSGAGFQPSYSDGSVTAPSYGPFLVRDADFLATGSTVSGLRVDAHPTLGIATDDSLRAAVSSLDSASGLLSARAGGAARITRVASELPATLRSLHTQQSTTRAAVMVVLLLSTTLALAGLLLAGRLVADTRADERELLTSLGQSRGQQLGTAVVEAGLLAVVAAVLAVPAAALTHSLMTHLPDLAAAGLTQGPTVTAGLVVTTLVGALLLTLVLTLSPLVRWEGGRLPARRRLLARSGVDVLLLVVAAAGWWQLHTRSTAAAGADLVLTLAPVLCLSAVALVGLRWLPPLLTLAARAGSRSRALLPLALHPVALRLGAGTVLVLLATASASATFGVALHTTWQRSQTDQAAVRVGTGLRLALSSQPSAEDTVAVGRAATRTASDAARPVVSAVTERPVALGRFVGNGSEPPQLVALDTRHAGALLRGRLPEGRTWPGVSEGLTPRARVEGVALPADGSGVQLVARGTAGLAVSVTPSVVLQDASGLRSTLAAATLPVDGRRHALRWTSPPPPGQRIVALRLVVADEGNVDTEGPPAGVSVTLRVPGRDTGSVTWQSRRLGRDSPVLTQSVDVRRAGDATVLTTRMQLNISYLLYTDADVLATAFDPPASVPVVVSQQLVDAVGTKVGGRLSATVGNSPVELRVTGIVPTIPSAPDRVAVLADADTLSRALIGTGLLEPVVDEFWVSRSTPRTTRAIGELRLGEVTTRDRVTAGLSRGPLQVTVPLAYLTLVVASLVLLLAGAVLVVSGDPRRRSDEVARLRALGLTRWGARRLLLVEHGALLVPLVLVGVLVGAGASWALATSMIRSDLGSAPVPRPVLVWPWVTEGVVAAGLVVGCLAVAAIAALVQVHRSDTAQLRTGE